MSRHARFAFNGLRAIVRVLQRNADGVPAVACAGDRRIHSGWPNDGSRTHLGVRGRQPVAYVVQVESHATICYH
jgi:hypothetical protein